MKILSILTFCLVALSALGFSEHQPQGGSAAFSLEDQPGKGRTVSEKYVDSEGNTLGGGLVRYEGLGEGKTGGKRWRKSGECWLESGTWKVHGKDVHAYSDTVHVNTMKELADDKATHGSIISEIGANNGSWGNPPAGD